MDQEEIINKTKKHVQSILEKEGSGHDWWHIQRVYNNALLIMKEEKCDQFLVEMAVILHDIGDYKLHDGIDKTRELVSSFLKELGLKESLIETIVTIIKEIGFSENKKAKPSSIEAMIAQDADRLDAIGAIGIARTFQYGGHKSRELYDPTRPPVENLSIEAYKKSDAPTINHFYEKLLLIKDLMNTNFAKKIAEGRHEFMKTFLVQFYEEWEGEK